MTALELLVPTAGMSPMTIMLSKYLPLKRQTQDSIRFVYSRIYSPRGFPKSTRLYPNSFPLCQYFSSSIPGQNQNVRSAYDESEDWRDWFTGREYIHPWGNDLEPLEDNPILDRQSRFLLDLLQTLYKVGLTRTSDRVTTERANKMIDRLAKQEDQSPTAMWQRAERARAILEAMELFEDLRETPNLPIPLPLATHETYWNVLRLYSTKFLHGTPKRDAPQRCLDIVQRMENSQRLELQTTSVHWNQVLSAYANCNDPERPIKAAQLLYRLNEQGMTDASSFSHTLRCCVSLERRQQHSSQKEREVAITVALRVWNGLKQSDTIEITPQQFVHMLRVTRNFQKSESAKKDSLARETFQEAITAQKVNVHVLQELLHVASPSLLQKLFKSKTYSKDPLQLIRQIPKEWIEPFDENDPDCDRKSNPYEW